MQRFLDGLLHNLSKFFRSTPQLSQKLQFNAFFRSFYFQIEVAPCDKKGREYNEADDKFVDSPEELIGKDVSFARVWIQ